MSRLTEIVSFIEHDFREKTVIEPEKRLEKVKEHLFDVIKTYKPGVIVKAGLGSGQLLYEMTKESRAYVTVVEPSFSIIREFLDIYKNDQVCENIRFINGEFNSFPVDYYAADLLVSIDNLDFLESGRVADEFRRALQFDGILFIACVVLQDNDMEGIYDDFMKKIFPLHNDYYLRDDLKTFLDLNEFDFIKGAMEYYDTDIQALADYFGRTFASGVKEPLALIEEQKTEFTELYGLNGTVISEPYYAGVFMRRKTA